MVLEDNFKKAVDLVDKSENILITTHTRPDGDACGSTAALCELFNHLDKKTQILLLSDLPQWYSFLFAAPPAIFSKNFSADKLNSFDLLVIIDTNSKSQLVVSNVEPLTGFADLLQNFRKPILVIDHHATSDGLGSVELIDTSAAAAGLIVYDLLKFADWPLSQKIADALFVAIAADTGWFHFANTDSRVHRACADLLDFGANSARLYHTLYQSFSPQRFDLMTKMLNTLQLHFDGRLATQYLLRKDFQQSGAADTDTENLIDECQRISSVEVAALFIELKDGRIRCSLRSRGNVDVRLIAQKFAGGGHKQAAGAFLPGPLQNAQNLILAEIKKHFS